MSRTLAIDPGNQGGMVLFRGEKLVEAIEWSGGFKGFCERLVVLLQSRRPGMTVVIEQPIPMRKKGWKTYLSQGMYLGAVTLFCTLGKHTEKPVYPVSWKAWLRKRTGGDTSKQAAMELAGFNHDGIADAWCMAHHHLEKA